MAEEIKCKQEECSIKNFEDFIRVEESESEFSQDIDIKNLFAEIGEACRKLLILFTTERDRWKR